MTPKEGFGIGGAHPREGNEPPSLNRITIESDIFVLPRKLVFVRVAAPLVFGEVLQVNNDSFSVRARDDAIRHLALKRKTVRACRRFGETEYLKQQMHTDERE